MSLFQKYGLPKNLEFKLSEKTLSLIADIGFKVSFAAKPQNANHGCFIYLEHVENGLMFAIDDYNNLLEDEDLYRILSGCETALKRWVGVARGSNLGIKFGKNDDDEACVKISLSNAIHDTNYQHGYCLTNEPADEIIPLTNDALNADAFCWMLKPIDGKSKSGGSNGSEIPNFIRDMLGR